MFYRSFFFFSFSWTLHNLERKLWIAYRTFYKKFNTKNLIFSTILNSKSSRPSFLRFPRRSSPLNHPYPRATLTQTHPETSKGGSRQTRKLSSVSLILRLFWNRSTHRKPLFTREERIPPRDGEVDEFFPGRVLSLSLSLPHPTRSTVKRKGKPSRASAPLGDNIRRH